MSTPETHPHYLNFPSGVHFPLDRHPVTGQMGVKLLPEVIAPLQASPLTAWHQLRQQVAYLETVTIRYLTDEQLILFDTHPDHRLRLIYSLSQQRLTDILPIPLPPQHPARHLLPDTLRPTLLPLDRQFRPRQRLIARVKYDHPLSGWHWYGAAFDGYEVFFGLIVGLQAQLGYFRLSELRTLQVGGIGVERDVGYAPQSLAALLTRHRDRLWE